MEIILMQFVNEILKWYEESFLYTWSRWKGTMRNPFSAHVIDNILGVRHQQQQLVLVGASLVAQMVKNLPATWEIWVWSLGWEDPLEKEMITHSYSCLENSMDRGAWWATAHGVSKSQTRLKWFSTHACLTASCVSSLVSSGPRFYLDICYCLVH